MDSLLKLEFLIGAFLAVLSICIYWQSRLLFEGVSVVVGKYLKTGIKLILKLEFGSINESFAQCNPQFTAIPLVLNAPIDYNTS